jgi:hypothetical protein
MRQLLPALTIPLSHCHSAALLVPDEFNTSTFLSLSLSEKKLTVTVASDDINRGEVVEYEVPLYRRRHGKSDYRLIYPLTSRFRNRFLPQKSGGGRGGGTKYQLPPPPHTGRVSRFIFQCCARKLFIFSVDNSSVLYAILQVISLLQKIHRKVYRFNVKYTVE